MKAKIVKATPAEKEAYAATGPVYPLYGYVTYESHRLQIEDLRGRSRPDNPKYEIMATPGHHFVDGVHSLLCYDQADIQDRLVSLEPCNETCEWHEVDNG